MKILLIALLLPLFVIPCGAEEYSFTRDEIEMSLGESWDGLLDGLPEEVRSEVDGVRPSEPGKSAEKVRELSSFTYWTGRIADEIKKALPSALSSLTPLLSVIILTSAASFLLPESSVCEAFELCTKLALSVMLLSTCAKLISGISSHLELLCRIMNLFVPVMQSFALALGNLTEQSVHSAAITLGVTLIGNFNTYLLTPLVSSLLTLTSASALAGDFGLGGAVSSFRKFISRLWQLCSIFFSFLLGIQSVLAKGSDSLVSKGAKFVIGSFVPVAGGMLSEAYGTIREGVMFIRGVCGFGGVAVLLLLTLPELIPVLMYKLGVFSAKTVSEALGCDSLTPLLDGVCGIVDFLIGIMLSVELMFVFAVLLFAKSW